MMKDTNMTRGETVKANRTLTSGPVTLAEKNELLVYVKTYSDGSHKFVSVRTGHAVKLSNLENLTIVVGPANADEIIARQESSSKAVLASWKAAGIKMS